MAVRKDRETQSSQRWIITGAKVKVTEQNNKPTVMTPL